MNKLVASVGLLVCFMIGPNIALSQSTIKVSVPENYYAKIYRVKPTCYDYSERFSRVDIFSASFGVPSSMIFVYSSIENNGDHAVLVGDSRWSYNYSTVSGHESFVDLTRFLMEPEEKMDPIEEEAAKNIALNYVANFFETPSNASISGVFFSRVWDESQITPDSSPNRVIERTSSESVVKIRRKIDGIPVCGPGGYYRIHVVNNGDVVGVFDRTHKFLTTPVDEIRLPVYEEIEAIAKEKEEKYCKDAKKCAVDVKVCYYEGSHGAEQEFIEPVIRVVVVNDSFEGDVGVVSFEMPIRDPEVADILHPEKVD